MAGVRTHLCFEHGDAEAAVALYIGLIPDSAVGRTVRAPADFPGGKAGALLLIEFTLSGQDFTALVGGPGVPFSPAISIQVTLPDQAEIDRVWGALVADGGEEGRCGWCKDRWGVSWQVVPAALDRLVTGGDPTAAARVFAAMVDMGRIDVASLERAAAAG